MPSLAAAGWGCGRRGTPCSTGGATHAELQEQFPGDEPDPRRAAGRHAGHHHRRAAGRGLALVAQLEQGRGGLYSHDWLENLAGCDIHSVDRIVPSLETIEVGDEVRLHPEVAGRSGPWSRARTSCSDPAPGGGWTAIWTERPSTTHGPSCSAGIPAGGPGCWSGARLLRPGAVAIVEPLAVVSAFMGSSSCAASATARQVARPIGDIRHRHALDPDGPDREDGVVATGRLRNSRLPGPCPRDG